MEESREDVFYECLTPPRTPSPQSAKSFHAPLSTPSILYREQSSSIHPKDSSDILQDDSSNKYKRFSTTHKLLFRTANTKSSSVGGKLSNDHMTGLNSTISHTTPPSSPSSAKTLQAATENEFASSEGCDESHLPSTPPLSPSASVSTSPSVSEPATPDGRGSIRTTRYSTPSSSTTSPQTSHPSGFGDLLDDNGVDSEEVNSTQTPVTPSPAPVCKSKKHNSRSLAAKKKSAPVKKRQIPKVSDHFLETGIYRREGLFLYDFPEKPDVVVATESVIGGKIIGYGTCPVQPTARELAAQKRRIMRNKGRHYGQNDELQVVLRNGSVAGESDTSEEAESETDKGSGSDVVKGEDTDTDSDSLIEAKLEDLSGCSVDETFA